MKDQRRSMILCENIVLGWPKSSFRFSCTILWENTSRLFGRPNIVYFPPWNTQILCLATCLTLNNTHFFVLLHSFWEVMREFSVITPAHPPPNPWGISSWENISELSLQVRHDWTWLYSQWQLYIGSYKAAVGMDCSGLSVIAGLYPGLAVLTWLDTTSRGLSQNTKTQVL